MKQHEPNTKCPQCGKHFYKFPCQLKTQNKTFCSAECRKAYFGKPKEPNALCGHCGKAVWRNPWQLKHQEHTFCSRSCKGTYMSIHGMAASKYKGGRIINDHGYAMVLIKDHPLANPRGYVLEHRLVMSKLVGRIIESHEHVHHINGVRSDNRPENLMLFKCRGEHSSFELNQKYAGNRSTVFCDRCGNPITRTNYKLDKWSSHYCSSDCRWSRKTYSCENCGKKVVKSPSKVMEHVFCSTACHYEWQKKNREMWTCSVCGKQFYRKWVRPNESGRYFCSVECSSQGRTKRKKQ